MTRPFPPQVLLEDIGRGCFIPSEEIADWAEATLISEDGLLSNEDHQHLRKASIGWLWTNEANVKGGRIVLGQAEKMPPMAMGKWSRARAILQIEEWFGDVPDFLITLHAPQCAEMDEASFLALVEHELYHCGQQRDEHGQPKFNSAGDPVFFLRGHDVEEFVGVVVRYGASALIANACGNCLRAVA